MNNLSKYNIGDWVKSISVKKSETFGHLGKIVGINTYNKIIYKVKINQISYYFERAELEKYSYIHKEFSLKWFRFSFFKLGKRFTLRLELSKGWEK